MNISAISKQIIIILILMLIGFYLALSSIISLSYIVENPELKKDIALRFESTVDTIKSRYLFTENFSPDVTSKQEEIAGTLNSITRIELEIEVDNALNDSTRMSFVQFAEPLIEEFTKHKTLLNNQGIQLIKWSYDLPRSRDKLFVQAKNLFKENITKLPNGLLSKYAENLTTYLSRLPSDDFYSINYNNYQRNFSILNQSMLTIRDKLEIIKTQLINQKAIPVTLYKNNNIVNFLPNDSSYNIISNVIFSEVPQPGEFGDDWGPIFSPFIRWIARSKNIDVLLLIGMIGFGLFGSAITVFINNTYNSLSQNIMLVIIRGFSAAIIVFLAMRGGIAVINNGDSNPNPLILFLFCFIGSVFSDPIWSWAKQRILNLFPSNPSSPPS